MLNRYNAGPRFGSGPRRRVFSSLSDVIPWRATGITIYLENDGRLEHAHGLIVSNTEMDDRNRSFSVPDDPNTRNSTSFPVKRAVIEFWSVFFWSNDP